MIAALITYINVRGIKIAAIFQTVMTLIIFIVGIFVIVSGVMMGDVDNMSTQLFAGSDSVSMLRGILAVSMITPFFYIGFDVIPQAAEEINVPLKKIGKIMISSIIIAVLFYALIIIAIGLLLEPGQVVNSTQGTRLTCVDAILAAYNIPALTNVVIIGGLCGLVTSWNSFVIGSSRALYAMAESYMIPHIFSNIHTKYHTPVYAVLLIGAVSMIAPLFGREMLTWMVDVANMGCCIAYFIVGLSFLLLRKNEPGMDRPYKVRKGILVGTLAICMSGFMVCMYIIPGTGSTLGWQEWIIAIAWCLLGLMFRTYSRYRYGDKFGHSESYYEENSDDADAQI